MTGVELGALGTGARAGCWATERPPDPADPRVAPEAEPTLDWPWTRTVTGPEAPDVSGAAALGAPLFGGAGADCCGEPDGAPEPALGDDGVPKPFGVHAHAKPTAATVAPSTETAIVMTNRVVLRTSPTSKTG